MAYNIADTDPLSLRYKYTLQQVEGKAVHIPHQIVESQQIFHVAIPDTPQRRWFPLFAIRPVIRETACAKYIHQRPDVNTQVHPITYT